jgi:hypothetical protein
MTKTPGSKPNDYEVGYRRPPRASQFQPGTSGNPRGRRKGSRSVGAILNGIMSQKVTVSEGGRTRRVSRLEVMLLRLANDAARGDARVTKLLLELNDRYGQPMGKPSCRIGTSKRSLISWSGFVAARSAG